MNTLYFQLSIPTAKFSERKLTPLTKSDSDVFDFMNIFKTKSACNECANVKRKRKFKDENVVPIDQERNIENKENFNLNRFIKCDDNDDDGCGSLSSTRKTIRTTRLAIRNSLSQLNLFSSSTTPTPTATTTTSSASSCTGGYIVKDDDNEFSSFRYPLEIKGLKIPKNKWTHLSFSIQPNGKEICVIILILYSLVYV